MNMNMTKKIGFLLILVLVGGGLFAQDEQEADRAWIFGASLSTNFPSGPWTELYTTNYSIGAHVARKTANNFIYSLEWDYLSGGEIPNRAETFGSILTDNGNILNSSGSFATYNINQRGTSFSLGIEKILPYFQQNPNSGLSIGLFGGYTWHWLNIDNVGNDAAQILEPYSYGYDRMSAGFHLGESIGYMYLSPNRMINFRISFDMRQIWSSELRKYQYATGLLSDQQSLNLLYSLKLKWYIPIYLGGKKEEYYYN